MLPTDDSFYETVPGSYGTFSKTPTVGVYGPVSSTTWNGRRGSVRRRLARDADRTRELLGAVGHVYGAAGDQGESVVEPHVRGAHRAASPFTRTSVTAWGIAPAGERRSSG